MEDFLLIVWETQREAGAIANIGKDFFAPLKERLKDLLSPKLYDEVENVMCGCQYEYESYIAVEGMKLAMGIMDKTYKVTI
jgi:hypothetical protein